MQAVVHGFAQLEWKETVRMITFACEERVRFAGSAWHGHGSEPTPPFTGMAMGGGTRHLCCKPEKKCVVPYVDFVKKRPKRCYPGLALINNCILLSFWLKFAHILYHVIKSLRRLVVSLVNVLPSCDGGKGEHHKSHWCHVLLLSQCRHFYMYRFTNAPNGWKHEQAYEVTIFSYAYRLTFKFTVRHLLLT